jgi:hypothetical protein
MCLAGTARVASGIRALNTGRIHLPLFGGDLIFLDAAAFWEICRFGFAITMGIGFLLGKLTGRVTTFRAGGVGLRLRGLVAKFRVPFEEGTFFGAKAGFGFEISFRVGFFGASIGFAIMAFTVTCLGLRTRAQGT